MSIQSEYESYNLSDAVVPQRYPGMLRALHWTMALLFLALFVIGPIMTDLDKQDPLRPALFGLHKSIGVLVILLLAARISVRLRSAMPPPAAGLSDLERIVSYGVHRAIYVLMVLTPLAGWATSDLHGKPVKLFGLPMPKIFRTVEDIGSLPGDIHTYLAFTLLGLVVIHIAAVVKHRLRNDDAVLRRML